MSKKVYKSPILTVLGNINKNTLGKGKGATDVGGQSGS